MSVSKDQFKLAGEVALVTGGSKNLGAEIVRRLARSGAAVAINHRDAGSRDDASALVEDLRREGHLAQAYECDVGDPAAVNEMVNLIADELGSPNLLINNAALAVAGDVPWYELTPEQWAPVLNVNVTAGFTCAKALYPHMRARGTGSIVNISSVRALLGREGNLHYTTSKAAQVGFTRTLAREIGPENIRVNCLVVGAIKTPDERLYGAEGEIDRACLAVQSLKRRGLPEDVAAVAAFLCSASSSFVTGQTLVIDGGWVMP